MKINKGIIKNINKKVVAGLLTFVLIPTVFAGCTSEEKIEFTYGINEQGEYVVDGSIEFDLLKNYYFIEISNPQFETTEFYIVQRYGINGFRGAFMGYSYVDIFTQNEVFRKTSDGVNYDSESSRIFVNEVKLEECLYSLNKVKGTYTKEDVEDIINAIKQIDIKQNNKQLVKE